MSKDKFDIQPGALERELTPAEENYIFWVTFICAGVLCFFAGIQIGSAIRCLNL